MLCVIVFSKEHHVTLNFENIYTLLRPIILPNGLYYFISSAFALIAVFFIRSASLGYIFSCLFERVLTFLNFKWRWKCRLSFWILVYFPRFFTTD